MTDSVKIVHQLPGRVRFKLNKLKMQPDCSGELHQYLLTLPGVLQVRLRPEIGSLILQYNPQKTDIEQLSEQITQLDWSVLSPTCDYETEYCGGDNLLNIAGLASTKLLPAAFAGWPALMLTAPTILTGLQALSNRTLTVEVLDALALSLSLARKDYSTAMLTQTLLTLGEYMEQQTTRNSDELLASLMHPKEGTVWVRRKRREVEINQHELLKGDLMLLGPGDIIPADGTIVKGLGLINQASMTGESVPVRRDVGAWVYSGTLIQEGNVVIKAEKVGADSSTAHIRQFIISALSQKSETQQTTQEMANRRILITLGVGALVFALTRDLTRLASVFLVDYSCALKLSTPIAFKSIMYRAANSGLLLKGGRVIEQLADVDTVVFDKTGTLTYGDMLVTEVISFDSDHVWAEDLLALAASIEEHSNHPLASAIVRAAKQHNLPHIHHGEVDYVIAHGMICSAGEDDLIIGSRHFLESHHHIDFTPYHAMISQYENNHHLLFISLNEQLSGMIALKDNLRDDAAEVIKQLRTLGIQKVVMLTGDKYGKAMQLAEQIGIDDVIAEADPEDKVEVVKQLQAQGHKVWFVGDGVNDAPVLTQADVGLAMQQSTELAQHAADAVLLYDDLAGLVVAKQLALEAMQLVNSNIRITEWVNSGIMLAAALGFLPPTASALLHNGTTLSVLLRSLLAKNAR